ncbi:MAG: sel1 repeat family protein [Armatimonadetes bacterium]|nr:sel1 repeat family protein [Akkermansiaceae bacterium]
MKRFLISICCIAIVFANPLGAAPPAKAKEKNPAPVKVTSPAKAALEAFEAGKHAEAVKMAKPLAEAGDPDAIYLLGFAHETGKGIEASHEQALSYYRKGSAMNHSDSSYRLSLLLMNSKEKKERYEALALLEKQAVKDPGVAGRFLGEAFLLGRFSEKPDVEKALLWWKKAGDFGDVPSMIFLARFYDGQMGFPENTDRVMALKYYETAAGKGNPGAMVAAGSRLLNGTTVKRNEAVGMAWLKKAIDARELSAYLAMGDYLEKIKKDLPAALAEYERGKDAGQVDCIVRAAEFHINGKGTKKDVARGTSLMKKAAEAGSGHAHLILAANILNRKAPDMLAGYGHLLAAANAGLPEAQNDLGLFYLSGKLGIADVSAAVSWFGRSAQANFAPAQNNLAAMHERGAGVPQNYETAAKLYALAAQQGNASATLSLARFQAAGAATKVNRETGWALGKLAEERGEKNATAFLAGLEKEFSKDQLAASKKELERIKSIK